MADIVLIPQHVAVNVPPLILEKFVKINVTKNVKTGEY